MYCCYDAPGAFGKVKKERNATKLAALGVSSSMLHVLERWLLPRHARVIVNGKQSRKIDMLDMVCQGSLGPTVLGCSTRML